MMTVGKNGYRLGEAQRKRVLTLIEESALDYHALEAEILQDEAALPRLRERMAEQDAKIGDLPDPHNTRGAGPRGAGPGDDRA
ncbi:MAG: hypothetical protein WCQ50_21540 [Spirochaetota bacterium]